MRARSAYMTSLVTTGILLAGTLILLGVVGALVVFHAWPQPSSRPPVGVGLRPRSPSVSFASFRTAAHIYHVDTVAPRRTPAPVPTAGLVKVTGPTAGVPLAVVAPGGLSTGPQPITGGPDQPASTASRDARSSPAPPRGHASPARGAPAPTPLEGPADTGMRIVGDVSPTAADLLAGALDAGPSQAPELGVGIPLPGVR